MNDEHAFVAVGYEGHLDQEWEQPLLVAESGQTHLLEKGVVFGLMVDYDIEKVSQILAEDFLVQCTVDSVCLCNNKLE